MIKAALAGVMATVLSLVSPAINWGLSGYGNEAIPAAPAGASQILSDFGGLYHLDTNEKQVLFTFDLGYEAGYTNEVLDVLKANNIKAIFFLAGNYLKETDLINRITSEGHMIGNHTDRHKDLPTLSDDKIQKDICDFQTKFCEKYPNAQCPVWFRPPKGRFDEKTLTIAKDCGLRCMMWSIATKDWGKEPINAEKTAQKIADRIHPGAVILSHITNAGTPKMLEVLIPLLTAKGYVTASPESIQ